MATPTLNSPPTTINAADVMTGWTFSGSAATQDTEFKKEGSASASGILRNDLSVGQYNQASGISMANQHMRCWINFTALAFLDSEVNSGMEFFATDGTNTAYWVVFGNDTYFGGWKNVIVNFEGTPSSGTKPTGNVTTWGFRFNRTAAPRQAINTWLDALRYGDGYTITGGTSGDKVTLDNIYTVDKASSYGVIDKVEGVYFALGKVTLGSGATTTYINFANSVLVFINSTRVASGLYALIGQGSGCNITITACVIQSQGADATRFAVDMDDANLAALSFTNNFITHAGACYFKSGQTVTYNTFDNCGQITHGGANLSGCIVKNYEGTADTAAVIYNVNADPDGEMDGMSFTKGTAATHAIEFGTTSPTDMTLRNCVFSGYNVNDSQNDSTFNILRTTGTVTINLVGCSGNASYKSAGATVVIVQNPVTTLITVKDTAVPPVAISGARVLVLAYSGGPMPYNVTVTITNSGTTATVSHTSHGMVTGDKVQITGASLWQNNGVFSITKINDNSYSYTMPEAPGSNPTGTIKATYAAIEGTTDGNGQISSSRTFSSSQPVTGRVRKSSSAPYYKTTDISGTISNSSGLSQIVQLLPDA